MNALTVKDHTWCIHITYVVTRQWNYILM